MKPVWDKLGDEFAGSSSVMIGDADCTAEGKELCEKFEVRGYPTIKYFADGDDAGSDYSGGRDFESLTNFVHETLEVKCTVKDPVLCTEKEKAYIEKMKAKSGNELDAQLARLKKMEGASMKPQLKTWMKQRLNILNGLKDEL